MGSFPLSSVVKNLPANTGGTGSIPDLGRSHVPESNGACAVEPGGRSCWSPHALGPCSPTVRSLRTEAERAHSRLDKGSAAAKTSTARNSQQRKNHHRPAEGTDTLEQRRVQKATAIWAPTKAPVQSNGIFNKQCWNNCRSVWAEHLIFFTK